MNEERRKMIAESVVAEAVAFYRLMVTTSTVFLGGTLVFWEKVAPKPTQETLVMLGAGWLFLIATIALVGFVRRDNIEAGRCALAEKWDDCESIGKRSRTATTLSVLFLALGMGLVAGAGLVSLWSKTHGHGTETPGREALGN